MMTAHQQNITKQQTIDQTKVGPEQWSAITRWHELFKNMRHVQHIQHCNLPEVCQIQDEHASWRTNVRHSIQQMTFSNKTIFLEVNKQQPTRCEPHTKKQATPKNATKTKTNIELHERSHDVANIRNCDLHTNIKEPPTQPKIKQKQYTNKPSKWQSHIS